MTKLIRAYNKRTLVEATVTTDNNYHHNNLHNHRIIFENTTSQLQSQQQIPLNLYQQNQQYHLRNQQYYHLAPSPYNSHHHPQNLYETDNQNLHHQQHLLINGELEHHQTISPVNTATTNTTTTTITNTNTNTNTNTTMLDTLQQPLSPRVTKRRRNRETPPRPLNSFMIYRREYQKRIKEEHPNILLSELSRISKSAADRWANESQQIKQLYAEKAKAEKEAHMKLYPNYVYSPRRPSRTKPRKKTTPGSDLSCEKMSLTFLLNTESTTFRQYNPNC
ncbi:hypothetical protein G9A89_006096 [Geosiphon pyriformis]|nr:hypothetical protein G9A89_006096 [Geosiphon pyriformis]